MLDVRQQQDLRRSCSLSRSCAVSSKRSCPPATHRRSRKHCSLSNGSVGSRKNTWVGRKRAVAQPGCSRTIACSGARAPRVRPSPLTLQRVPADACRSTPCVTEQVSPGTAVAGVVSKASRTLHTKGGARCFVHTSSVTLWPCRKVARPRSTSLLSSTFSSFCSSSLWSSRPRDPASSKQRSQGVLPLIK